MLTEEIINNAEVREKRYRIWDSTGYGLFVEILPSGKKSYGIKYRLNNLENTKKLGSVEAISLEEARKLAFNLKKNIRVSKGTVFTPSFAKTEKLAEILNFINLTYDLLHSRHQKLLKETEASESLLKEFYEYAQEIKNIILDRDEK